MIWENITFADNRQMFLVFATKCGTAFAKVHSAFKMLIFFKTEHLFFLPLQLSIYFANL